MIKKHPGGHRGFGPAIFPARDLRNYQSNAGRHGKEKQMQDTCIHLLRSLESEQKSRMVINLTVQL